jgi:hypothetical protein
MCIHCDRAKKIILDAGTGNLAELTMKNLLMQKIVSEILKSHPSYEPAHLLSGSTMLGTQHMEDAAEDAATFNVILDELEVAFADPRSALGGFLELGM